MANTPFYNKSEGEKMNKKEIEEKLKKESNAILLLEIEYNNKKYIKVMLNDGSEFEYRYYEVLDEAIKPVEDNNILEYLKQVYEIQENNIIY